MTTTVTTTAYHWTAREALQGLDLVFSGLIASQPCLAASMAKAVLALVGSAGIDRHMPTLASYCRRADMLQPTPEEDIPF